jgi:catechol 2,3-dioxygenase-like lactoylglutathione lyase family enzyme
MAEIGWRKMEKPISGIHHVTAIAWNPQRNLDFYIEVLRLSWSNARSNLDDPGTYHFYSTLRTRQELPARFSHCSLGLASRVGTLDRARSR